MAWSGMASGQLSHQIPIMSLAAHEVIGLRSSKRAQLADGMLAFVGPSRPGRDASMVYRWDATSTQPHDGVDVVSLLEGAAGRWVRVSASRLPSGSSLLQAEESPGLVDTDRVSLLDRIDPGKYQAIAAGNYALDDPAFDLTDVFDAALAQLLERPNGGEIELPPGLFMMSMDLRQAGASDFQRTIRVAGSGRGVTVIRPSRSGEPILNLAGRNRATIQDLTIRSGERYQASCGIYVARTRNSANANNNKFLNLEIEGNFSGPAVVSCAAESSLWFNCRIAPSPNGSGVGFWTGTDPLLARLSVPGVQAVIGPNSDNRMIASEFYMPFAGAKCLTVSRAGAWLFDATSFVIGPVDRGGAKMVVIEDFDGGVFNGPIHFRDCHWEVFGPETYGIFAGGTGLRYLYDLSVSNGFAVVDPRFKMIDYAGSEPDPQARGLYLMGGRFDAPAVPSGDGSRVDLDFRVWAIERAHVHWRTRGDGGVLNIGTFAKNCFLDAARLTLPQNIDSLVLGSAPAGG
jgi:hypothetical protein